MLLTYKFDEINGINVIFFDNNKNNFLSWQTLIKWNLLNGMKKEKMVNFRCCFLLCVRNWMVHHHLWKKIFYFEPLNDITINSCTQEQTTLLWTDFINTILIINIWVSKKLSSRASRQNYQGLYGRTNYVWMKLCEWSDQVISWTI